MLNFNDHSQLNYVDAIPETDKDAFFYEETNGYSLKDVVAIAEADNKRLIFDLDMKAKLDQIQHHLPEDHIEFVDFKLESTKFRRKSQAIFYGFDEDAVMVRSASDRVYKTLKDAILHANLHGKTIYIRSPASASAREKQGAFKLSDLQELHANLKNGDFRLLATIPDTNGERTVVMDSFNKTSLGQYLDNVKVLNSKQLLNILKHTLIHDFDMTSERLKRDTWQNILVKQNYTVPLLINDLINQGYAFLDLEKNFLNLTTIREKIKKITQDIKSKKAHADMVVATQEP